MKTLRVLCLSLAVFVSCAPRSDIPQVEEAQSEQVALPKKVKIFVNVWCKNNEGMAIREESSRIHEAVVRLMQSAGFEVLGPSQGENKFVLALLVRAKVSELPANEFLPTYYPHATVSVTPVINIPGSTFVPSQPCPNLSGGVPRAGGWSRSEYRSPMQAVEEALGLRRSRFEASQRSLGYRRRGHPSPLMVCVLQVLAKRFGTEIALNALENETYRQEAIAALGVVGDKSAVRRLLIILQSQEEEDDIRREAALALGNIGDNRAVKPLVETLDNWSLREQAATALGNIGDRSAVDALIVALQEYGPDNVWFLKSAAEALGRIGDTRALVPLLRSDLRWYGAEVRQVFREFGRTAIDPLISILKTGDAYLQHQAAQALEFITDENFGSDPVAWQKWWDNNR